VVNSQVLEWGERTSSNSFAEGRGFELRGRRRGECPVRGRNKKKVARHSKTQKNLGTCPFQTIKHSGLEGHCLGLGKKLGTGLLQRSGPSDMSRGGGHCSKKPKGEKGKEVSTARIQGRPFNWPFRKSERKKKGTEDIIHRVRRKRAE